MVSDVGEPPFDVVSAHEATRLVRGGLHRSEFHETSEALFLTSGYVYESAAEAAAAFAGRVDRFVYSRFGNPTVAAFEERMRVLERAEACLATATGMAAVFASLACQASAGDRIVASRALFGSCHIVLVDILPRFGIETVLVDGTSLDEWAAALEDGAAAVFVETPSNPVLEIIDLVAVSELAHAAGACVVVDNVLASPVLQAPLTLGADVVVYSATKHIDGQGRTLGGAVLGSEEFVVERILPFTRHTGPSLSPFNAWTLLKGLETLSLRVDAMCCSAERIARTLEDHARIGAVRYPGLPSHPEYALAMKQMKRGGTVIVLEIDGGREEAFRFIDGLRLFDISNNLGDAKSLVTHPASTTHSGLEPRERALAGVTDSMVRLSIGLEDPGDLGDDLLGSLERFTSN